MIFPTELVTFGVSFLARAIQQHLAYKQANEAAEREYTLKIAGLKKSMYSTAHKTFNNNGVFAWTCSILAILAFLAIVVLPKVAVLFDPTLLVHYGFTSDDPGSSILWGLIEFTSAHTETAFQSVKGILITPVDSHLVASIAGMYFGGLNVKRKG